MVKEIWKDIIGYEDLYTVSNKGRVKSLTRIRDDGGVVISRILKLQKHSGGYLVVFLCRKGSVTQFLVHTLVLSAFIGLRPQDRECCHNDGNKYNNSINNLRWGTRRSNNLDIIKHGRSNLGKKQSKEQIKKVLGLIRNPKLTWEKVNSIRKLYSTGKFKQYELANKFNVGSSQLSNIINNKSWTKAKETTVEIW